MKAGNCSGENNSFLVFVHPRLEDEWLGWSEETYRKIERRGAAASLTVSVLLLVGVFCSGALSNKTLAAFSVDVLVSAWVLLGPCVPTADLRIRTYRCTLLRAFFFPLVSRMLLTSLDLTPIVGAKASRFLTFFFPLHLILGAFRFPLRFREHVIAQLAAAAVSGCAAGFFCLDYFAFRDEHELIRKIGGFLALASTGLTIEGATSLTTSCMTLSFQLQAIFGMFPTVLVVYWTEWKSRMAFLDTKLGVQKKRT